MGAERIEKNGEDIYKSFSETKRLFEWGFSSFNRTKILDHAALVEEVPVTLSRKTNYVSVHPAADVEVLLPSNVKVEDLEQKIQLDAESVQAPITEGQKLGTITISDKDGTVYTTSALLASNEVPASTLLTILYKLKVFFSNPIVKIVSVLLAAALLLLIVKVIRRRPKRYRGGQSYRTRHRNQHYHGRRR